MDGNIASNGQFVPNSSVANFNAGNSPIISSGQDDIILTPSQSRSSRKKCPFVMVVALFVIAIVTGVAAVIVGSGNGNAEMKDFNKFANFVLYGKESDENIPSVYDASESYYFLAHQSTQEEQTELYNRTNALLDDFLKSYRASGKRTDSAELLAVAVDDEVQLMEFMNVAYTKQSPTSSYVEDVYIETGSALAAQKLLQYYDFSQLDGNSYAADFIVNYENWVSLQIKYLDLFRDNDCLIDGTASSYCIYQKGDPDFEETVEESRENARNALMALNGYFGYSVSFITNIFAINRLLNGGEGSVNIVTGDADE